MADTIIYVKDPKTTVLQPVKLVDNLDGTYSLGPSGGAASATELAKVPKSDGTASWNATALAAINTQADLALNTIVPAAPTAGSLNDFLSKASGGNTFNKATDSLEALADAISGLGLTQIATGTLTTSDLVLPADSARTEGNDAFKGCIFVPTSGAAINQPKLIIAYTGTGGIFALDTGNPLNVLPGLCTYKILTNVTQFAPVVDGTNAYTPSEATGNKASTALYSKSDTADMFRYLKGLMDAGIIIQAAVNDAGASTTAFITTLTEATNGHYGSLLVLFLTGANAGQAHHVDSYVGGTKQMVFRTGDAWTDTPVTGDKFVILPDSVAYLAAQLVTYDILHEVNDTAVTLNATNVEADIFSGAVVVNHHYMIRCMRLKCADPGAQTVTVRLYELINDVEVLVDTFAITTANYTNYFNLMDMFGVPYLAGDLVRVAVIASDAGPYAITGQYSQATTG